MIRAAAVALLLAIGPALADDMPMPAGQAHAAMPMAGTRNDPASAALMRAMDGMTKGMAKPMTGDPDKDFAAMMIVHHQGAVAMAKVQLQYGKDPTLRALAKAIVAAQEKEIAEMQGWQATHAK